MWRSIFISGNIVNGTQLSKFTMYYFNFYNSLRALREVIPAFNSFKYVPVMEYVREIFRKFNMIFDIRSFNPRVNNDSVENCKLCTCFSLEKYVEFIFGYFRRSSQGCSQPTCSSWCFSVQFSAKLMWIYIYRVYWIKIWIGSKEYRRFCYRI